jgi:TPP-dependent pyruvate/acetoin dehydrogenase alpha subunit
MQATGSLIGVELSHRTIASIGRYKELDVGGVERSTLLKLLHQMLRLRRMEEALLAEYHPANEMRCPVHFCIGQEAVPAALSLVVDPEDYLFSHHRSHGYYFAKGAPLRELFSEIYGRETGANGGRAGSQDISHHASRFYSGAILSGAVSIAAGAAFGLQLNGSPNISISGFGEGATDEGAFWEAMNYAGAKKLPLLLVCENNRYATYSDQLKRQAADNIGERVATFGVRARRIFGNDVVKAWRTLKEEAGLIRSGHGPALVEAYTYRWNSHVGPEDDGANNYRDASEIQFWKNNCPVSLLEEKLFAGALLSTVDKKSLEEQVAAEIVENFQFAKQSSFPIGADWRAMNWDDSSPVADRLLGTHSLSSFDQYQAEAKLEPY